MKDNIREAALTKLAQYGNPSVADVASKPIDVVQTGVSGRTVFLNLVDSTIHYG